eukprot:UN30703
MDWQGQRIDLTVKIKTINLNQMKFDSILRVGWLGDDVALYSSWKRSIDCIAKWGSSDILTKTVDVVPKYKICLVLQQKIGEQAVPVGIISIPAESSFNNEDSKIPFDLGIKTLEPLGGKAQGYIIATKESPSSSVGPEHSGSQSQTVTRSRSYGSRGKSHTGSNMGTPRTKTESIDLVNEIPRKFYKIIPVREVYRKVVRKFKNDLTLEKSALRYLITVPPDERTFKIPQTNQI